MMRTKLNKLIRLIKNNLTDELRKPIYRNSKNRLAGHCYVTAETLFHLTNKTLKPMFMQHEGSPHWFLISADGKIIDITRSQFKSKPNYPKARGKGFLTKFPSKRARELMERIK